MNNRCEICKQLIENDDKFHCNNCDREYHISCIATSLETNPLCTICKFPFLKEEKVPEQEIMQNPVKIPQKSWIREYPSIVIMMVLVAVLFVYAIITTSVVAFVGGGVVSILAGVRVLYDFTREEGKKNE